MNKSDLVDAIAAATNEGRSKVAALLEAVLDHISAALQKGEKVTLPGFGTFETRKRQARSGRNPRTGAPVKIAATTAPVFKAGATLKGSVAGNKKTAAKAGARSKASAKAKAAVALAAAGIIGLMVLVFAGLTAAAALDNVLPPWGSRLVVTGGFALLAIVAVLFGLARLRKPGLMPEQTKRTLKEGEEWAIAQLQR